jgi:hypothetical protein
LIRAVAWNLLSFRPEFGGAVQSFKQAGAHDLYAKHQHFFAQKLGESHGYDGRRRLEDGERQ